MCIVSSGTAPNLQFYNAATLRFLHCPKFARYRRCTCKKQRQTFRYSLAFCNSLDTFGHSRFFVITILNGLKRGIHLRRDFRVHATIYAHVYNVVFIVYKRYIIVIWKIFFNNIVKRLLVNNYIIFSGRRVYEVIKIDLPNEMWKRRKRPFRHCSATV